MAGNPLCLCRNYAARVSSGLPLLQTLDGHVISPRDNSPPVSVGGTEDLEARGEVMVRVEVSDTEYFPPPPSGGDSAFEEGADQGHSEDGQRLAGEFFIEIRVGEATLSTRPPAVEDGDVGASAEADGDAGEATGARSITVVLPLLEARDILREGLQATLVVYQQDESAPAVEEGSDPPPEGDAIPILERVERVVGRGVFTAPALVAGAPEEEGVLEFGPVPELIDESNIFMSLEDPRQPAGALGKCRIRVSLPAPEPAEPEGAEGADTEL